MPKTKKRHLSNGACNDAAAARNLGITTRQFHQIVKSRGYKPDDSFGMWYRTTLAKIARTREYKALREPSKWATASTHPRLESELRKQFGIGIADVNRILQGN
jgi:hypothetical protein